MFNFNSGYYFASSVLQDVDSSTKTTIESPWFDENDYEYNQDNATTDRFSWEKGGAHASY